MKAAKIGLFFGSDEGNTESISHRIARRLGEDIVDIHDIGEVTQLEFMDYDKFILGIPTWDFGQIQSDWEDFWEDLENIDFSGKQYCIKKGIEIYYNSRGHRFSSSEIRSRLKN